MLHHDKYQSFGVCISSMQVLSESRKLSLLVYVAWDRFCVGHPLCMGSAVCPLKIQCLLLVWILIVFLFL